MLQWVRVGNRCVPAGLGRSGQIAITGLSNLSKHCWVSHETGRMATDWRCGHNDLDCSGLRYCGLGTMGQPSVYFLIRVRLPFCRVHPDCRATATEADPKTGEVRGPTQVVASLSPVPIVQAALVPPFGAWLLAYLIVWTFQWGKKGFKAN